VRFLHQNQNKGADLEENRKRRSWGGKKGVKGAGKGGGAKGGKGKTSNVFKAGCLLQAVEEKIREWSRAKKGKD